MSRTYRNLISTNFPPMASATRQEIVDHLNLDAEGFERLLRLKAIEPENDLPEPPLLPPDEFPDAPPAKFPAGFKPDKLAVLQIQNAICDFVWGAVLARLPDAVSRVVREVLEGASPGPIPKPVPPGVDPLPDAPPIPAPEVPISNMSGPDSPDGFFPLRTVEPVQESPAAVEPGGEPAADPVETPPASLDPVAAAPVEPPAAFVVNEQAAEALAAEDATRFDISPTFAGGATMPETKAPTFAAEKVGENTPAGSSGRRGRNGRTG